MQKNIKTGKKPSEAMKKTVVFLMIFLVVCIGFFLITRHANEKKILKEVITRLKSDSRIAEVLVTDVRVGQQAGQELTTIKFLEYDARGNALPPRFFTFPGNIIQFQSLVIRFDDDFICRNDKLKGKSIYLFWKVFMLDGANTREFELVKVNEIPCGYKIEGVKSKFELELWQKFWQYALDSGHAELAGIKCAQIEAPGTRFVPGVLYTIKIEHDGGIRIDTQVLPSILEGERVFKKRS